ncbi:hypothetical protein OIU74_030038 [Salix koriyanagi]|uniref:Uncharacterized protein n=1 Tax=Salix koriyanagi TaxID=2511006 RepID=A0A9Q0VF75_9ROSI|nr:hypothetical protein OIU74_030038 [Salix koriyanagi]
MEAFEIFVLQKEGVPHQQEKKQGGEEGITTVSFFDRIVTVDQHMIHGSVVTSPLWSSKGMVERCKSVSWEMLLDWLDLGLVLGLGLGLGFAAFPAGFFDSSEICCLLSILADFSTARLFSVQLCVWLGYCWGRFLSARFTWVFAAQFPAFDHSSGVLQ